MRIGRRFVLPLVVLAVPAAAYASLLLLSRPSNDRNWKPEHARLPMYSTWYSFHLDITPELIEKQCRLAKELGMDSVIEDAGSRNGTRVNGELVRRHVLKHGDLVRVGSASFRYVDTATGSDKSK